MHSYTLSLTSALDGVGDQRHGPTSLPPGKTRYPLYRRLDRPQGRSGRVRKISPPPGFDPWTVQPVASRFADLAIPANCSTKVSSFVNTSAGQIDTCFPFSRKLKISYYMK